MLLDRITTDRNSFRSDKEKDIEFKLLTTLYSDLSLEMKNKGKDTLSNEEVLALLNKYKKNTTESLKLIPEGDPRQGEYQREMDLLLSYLPQQLSKDELKEIIATSGLDNIGAVMGMLKKEYNGRFDPKEASAMVKELLS